nr:uncharacterized protein LOC126054413 [Helicoverpa armigera]XP_049696008.1 uncharacterized protein LOC126054413 [Helicoverpa armigera]
MDAYTKLIQGSQLYSIDVIEQFGKRHPKWYSMNGREKESHLLHVMLCMLLCNKEKINKRALAKKRKNESLQLEKIKVQKTQEGQDPLEGTSKQYTSGSVIGSVTSGSSGSNTTTEDDMNLEDNDEEEITDFRFKMLNHMPMKNQTLKDICTEWGIPEVSYQWDIIDLEEKRLVRVRYSYNLGSDVHKYLRAKAEIPNRSDMYIIEAGKTKGKWMDHNKKAIGETKVTKFLIEREIVLKQHGINDNLYLPPVEIETVFPSIWLSEELMKWEKDLLATQNDQYTESELYIKENPPTTITPSDFLKNLRPIEESTIPSECIKWKGKILPEGFCHNIQTRETTDNNIITTVLTTIKMSMGREVRTYKVNMKDDSALDENILTDIIEIWENSDHNTFSFMDSISFTQGKLIKEALGIGRKGITHSVYMDDMVQPEYKENPGLKYSPWIEEVFIRMAEDTHLPIGYTPCPELLKMSNNDGHPLPYLCEPITSEMLSDILKTNTGIQLSKLTNTYSRLGGAYGNI